MQNGCSASHILLALFFRWQSSAFICFYKPKDALPFFVLFNPPPPLSQCWKLWVGTPWHVWSRGTPLWMFCKHCDPVLLIVLLCAAVVSLSAPFLSGVLCFGALCTLQPWVTLQLLRQHLPV